MGGAIGGEALVEPIQRVTDARTEPAGAPVGPRPDGEPGLASCGAQGEEVVDLRREKDVVPTGHEGRRRRARASGPEVDRVPPGIAWRVVSEPVLIEADAPADDTSIGVA